MSLRIFSHPSEAFLYDYIKSLLGTPYKWGGSNVLMGFDCSGLVVEILQAAGVLPEHSDFTANGLYQIYRANAIPLCQFGALIFFGKNAKAVEHVGFCLNEHLMVEAGGGDSTVTDLCEATARDAVVRIRPALKTRSDILQVLKPKYLWEK